MRRVGPVILLLLYIGVSVRAQEQPPQLVIRAANCLVVKNFLPSLNASVLIFGYFLDEKSYSPEKVLYLVKYTKAPSRGLVFAIFLTEENGRQVFNIQNNASFVYSKHNFDFINAPLGGTWTQEHLISAIKQIAKQPPIIIFTKQLLTRDTSTNCESYADSQK
jgi:hypothetical protein